MTKVDGRVDGKVAIVTGGGRGMGNGSARVLARNGAKVAIVGRSDNVFEAADALCKDGYEAIAYKADISDAKRIKECYDDVAKKYGKIDILVNAAAIGDQKLFIEVDDEYLNKYINVNIKGTWNSCKAALPHMLKNGYGKIVNFASVTGVMVADPGMTVYGLTKGAIMAFTKALGMEMATKNITVNAILPGVVDTPMMRNTCIDTCPEDPDSIFNAVAEGVPMGRMGTMEEAGKVVLFLASDDSSYVTGTSIVFDGGSTLPESPGTGWTPEQ